MSRETNTVLVELCDYNELRDFKKAIEKDSKWTGAVYNNVYTRVPYLKTESDIIKALEQNITDIIESNDRLMKEDRDMIENLKSRSIWERITRKYE